MSFLGKISRELLCNRTKLTLVFVFVMLLLLYTYSCSLGLSSNCSTVSTSRLSGQLSVDLPKSVELITQSENDNLMERRHNGGNEVEISIGITTQTEGYDKLVSPEETVSVRKASFNDDNLEEWDLDRFYQMPHNSKESKHFQQEPKIKPQVKLEQATQNEAAIPQEEKIVEKGNFKVQRDVPNPSAKRKIIVNQPIKEPSNPVVGYEKKKAEKAIKRKKSKKKVIPLLPDSFPYFENHCPPPRIGGYTCSNGLCSEFLSDLDKTFYKECVSRLKMSKKLSDRDHAPGECHFINGTRRAAVGLVSFPGSGNTWVRGLLEKATGVCTGSVYCDNVLRIAGMNGESVRSGAVLVVKTHKSFLVNWTSEDQPHMGTKKYPSYGAAIVIVRNPFHALVAEWSRSVSSANTHTNEVNKGAFGNNSLWHKFILDRLLRWQEFFDYWVVGRQQHRVLVIRFEDLKEDILGTVKKMLHFLKFPFKEEELKESLSEDFGTFKRKHKEEFEHYTDEQKAAIRLAIEESIDYLLEKNDGITYGIENYLK